MCVFKFIYFEFVFEFLVFWFVFFVDMIIDIYVIVGRIGCYGSVVYKISNGLLINIVCRIDKYMCYVCLCDRLLLI